MEPANYQLVNLYPFPDHTYRGTILGAIKLMNSESIGNLIVKRLLCDIG
jgi:hypothetical protein